MSDEVHGHKLGYAPTPPRRPFRLSRRAVRWLVALSVFVVIAVAWLVTEERRELRRQAAAEAHESRLNEKVKRGGDPRFREVRIFETRDMMRLQGVVPTRADLDALRDIVASAGPSPLPYEWLVRVAAEAATGPSDYTNP